MQIDIIADSDKGAYEFHQRIRTTMDSLSYTEWNKTLSISNCGTSIVFRAVSLSTIENDGVSLRGLIDADSSGTGKAPISRIIKIKYTGNL